MSAFKSTYGPSDRCFGPFDPDRHLKMLVVLAGCHRWMIDDGWLQKDLSWEEGITETAKADVWSSNSVWFVGYVRGEEYGILHLSHIEPTRHCWINGYAKPGHFKDALFFTKLGLRYAFNVIGVHKVSTEFCAENKVIDFITGKAGMVEEARLPEMKWFVHKGLKEPKDLIIKAAYRRDYEG